MNTIIIEQKVLLIRVSRLFHEQMTPEDLYEATRDVWKIGDRRENAVYAFTVGNGEIQEAYKIGS
jgi:hypothetical protein